MQGRAIGQAEAEAEADAKRCGDTPLLEAVWLRIKDSTQKGEGLAVSA